MDRNVVRDMMRITEHNMDELQWQVVPDGSDWCSVELGVPTDQR